MPEIIKDTDIGLPKDADGSELITGKDKVIPAEVVPVPERIERPSIRYSFDKESLKVGSCIELPIIVDSVEVDRLKYVVEQAPTEGNEIRPVIFMNVVEMSAFSKQE